MFGCSGREVQNEVSNSLVTHTKRDTGDVITVARNPEGRFISDQVVTGLRQ